MYSDGKDVVVCLEGGRQCTAEESGDKREVLEVYVEKEESGAVEGLLVG